ncbi:MAG: nickel pincer cofactor biosynthesis protein LarB [Acidobacteriota bacterium]
MNPDQILRILQEVSSGAIAAEDAAQKLRLLPFEDLGFAKLDHHRHLRRGFPEVIFGPGKTPTQIRDIASRLLDQGQNVLVTRTNETAFREVAAAHADAQWHEAARAVVVERNPLPRSGQQVTVVAAGTSDIPVAEEAALTAELMGPKVERVFDVGVAGLHRLTAHQELLAVARAIVVVAGMEGALPSVVAGLVAVPVIAVPTSVGYGSSLGGLSALLAMLNSCSPGIATVNIDNGFGAGYVAGLMAASPGQPTE